MELFLWGELYTEGAVSKGLLNGATRCSDAAMGNRRLLHQSARTPWQCTGRLCQSWPGHRHSEARATKPATGNYLKPQSQHGHSQTCVMYRVAHQAIHIHKSSPITVALTPATNSIPSPISHKNKQNKKKMHQFGLILIYVEWMIPILPMASWPTAGIVTFRWILQAF